MNPTKASVPVSVLIPAKDEELNLPDCLASLQRADEIFLVDSQSQDQTQAIAHSYGAKVVQFYFNGHSPKKKNWALENLPFRNNWVLIVDCDERIPDTLWDEIAKAIQNPTYDGYYLNRRVYFLGKWLRHGGKYPDWNLRLFKHTHGRYENLGTEGVTNTGDNEVHEHVLLKGQSGYLQNDMLHIDLRGLYYWIERHNRYSNWEARVYYNLLKDRNRHHQIQATLFGGPIQRKRFLKKIWVRLPLRPLLRFFVFYILRLGLLDGKAGFIHACLMSQYEHQIGIKLYEMLKLDGHLNPLHLSQETVTLPVDLPLNIASPSHPEQLSKPGKSY